MDLLKGMIPKKSKNGTKLYQTNRQKNLHDAQVQEKLSDTATTITTKNITQTSNIIQSNPSPTSPKIPLAEMTKKLRAKGQPVRLFGESYDQILDRLHKLESQEVNDDGCQSNDFQFLLKQTEIKNANERFQEGEADKDEDKNNSVHKDKKQKIALTEEKIDTSIITPGLYKSDPDKCRFLIATYLKGMLNQWEHFLSKRSVSEKESAHGKSVSTMCSQSFGYLKPFFRDLKKNRVIGDVVGLIAEICQWMQAREYQKANDAYLRLSIGNAPWPIGVTMVGIHERAGREKIFSSSQVGHVLNDETQRKYIQSIKRLMTFCQKINPPSDLSKLVG